MKGGEGGWVGWGGVGGRGGLDFFQEKERNCRLKSCFYLFDRIKSTPINACENAQFL